MDFNIVSCSQGDLKNIGKPGCEHKLGMTKRMFITDKDFAFDDVPTKATFQAAIQNKNIFPLTVCQEVEDVSTEKQMYEPASGESVVMAQAVKGIRVMLTISPYEFVNLLSFDGRQFRIFEFDHLGNLIGCDRDGDKTKFAGFLTDEFSVENMTVPGDRSTPRNTPVFVKYADRAEYTTKLATFEDLGFLNTINGLLDATVTVTDATTTGCTVTVTSTATQKGVSGLVIADFVFKDSASGLEVTPSSVTESADTPGEYAVVATFTAGTYTADLLAPASMVTEGWDSTGPAEFTTTP
jgi:hypothetical protein